MDWTIEEIGYDKSKIEFLGSKFCIGNGYYGYRGCLDEYAKEQLTALTLSEIYDDNGSGWREPINVQNPIHTLVYYNNTPLSVFNSKIKSHSQKLNTYNGLHTRRTEYEIEDNIFTVCSERFASFDNRHLLIMKYTVKSEIDIDIILKTSIDTQIWDANGSHFKSTEAETSNDMNTIVSQTIECNRRVAISEITVVDGNYEKLSGNELERIYKIHLKKEQPVSLIKYVSICKDSDCKNVKKDSVKQVLSAANSGYNSLYLKNQEAWKSLWKNFNIKIDGDDQAQLAIRYSIYLLLISAPFHTDKVAIPARGLSGQVYKGAMFWDTEIYMLQMFAYCYPEVAKNLMMYRVNNLEGALEKANEYNFRGAFYPWESQETGKDGCTHYNLVDIFTGRKMRTYFRDKQIHISADVVYGLWRYIQITHDYDILLKGGAEVILECARFFTSYSYYKKDKNRYELLDVTGADEYHERINNDAYTNYLVKLCLKCALETIEYLETNHCSKYAQIIEKLGYQDDIKQITDMYEKLYIPLPNQEGIIEQFDGYFNQEDISLKELYKRIIKPNEYLGSPCGLAVNTQIIKQADVILLLALLSDNFNNDVKEKNWTYYEPRTEHGSSLSTCIYALLAAQIGKSDWAYDYLMKAAQIDLLGNYKLYLGDLYIGGTHPAANGGTWMVTVLGFGGLSILDGKVKVEPKLPPKWNSLSFHSYFKGNGFNIFVSNQKIIIEADKENKDEVEFIIKNKNYKFLNKLEVNL